MDLLVALVAGSAVGVATGLLPGVHVNTLAAIGLAAWPSGGLVATVFILSVGTVHTVVNILPGTYLGVPDDEGVSLLPAHQLLLSGRGPEAVATSVRASLLALVACAALAPLYMLGLQRMIAFLDAWAPWILLTAMAGLWVQEVVRQGMRGAWAIPVSAAAAAAGWVAFQTPMQPLVPLPATPLLPLLGGLFGGAALTHALGRSRCVPTQMHGGRSRAWPATLASASLLAGATAVLPGMTSAVAASYIPGRAHHPLRTVAALSAVNSAHASLSLVVWMGLGRIRTGLADAANQWHPVAWQASSSPDGWLLLAVVCAAGACGGAATLLLNRAVAVRANRLPSRALAMGALGFLAVVVVTLSGWTGMLLAAFCTALGRVPLRLRVRRVHLVAALTGPVIARSFGVA